MKIPDGAELRASDERAFRTSWLVYEDYIVRKGVLQPLANGVPIGILSARGATKRYLPIARIELPFEFAKLANSSEDTILRFVRNYGLLGYHQAVNTTLGVFKFAASLQQGKSPADKYLVHPGIDFGDPVSWILSHAETVKLVLDLNEALKDRQLLKQILERMTVQGESWPIGFRYIERGHLYSHSIKMIREGKDDFDCIRGIIAHIMNRNLNGGISRELILDVNPERRSEGRHLLSVFGANSLIDCIYWLLADAIVGNSIKRCKFCNRFFNVSTLKRIYCPPPMGNLGNGPCAQNDRARRKRALNKATELSKSKRDRMGRK